MQVKSNAKGDSMSFMQAKISKNKNNKHFKKYQLLRFCIYPTTEF